MQGTARAAAGSHGEVLLALLIAFLLIGAGYRVLEAGGVGGVPGNGNVHAFIPHDSHAFAHVIAAVHAHGGFGALGESFLLDDVQLARGIVKLGLHVREPVDAGDDVRGILAEAVQADAEILFADAVGRLGNTDGAFSGGKGFVTGQEAEAFRFIAQEHGGQVAVAQAHLAFIRNGAGNAEGLKAFSDGFSGVGGLRAALLNGDGGSHHIGPAGVFKRDGLNAVHNFTGVDSLGKAELFRFFNGADAVFGQGFIDLLDAAVVGFEKRHNGNSA